MSAHAELGDENSQNGYRFGDVILLAISACCRLQDLVSEYITPFLHSASQMLEIQLLLLLLNRLVNYTALDCNSTNILLRYRLIPIIAYIS